MKKETLDEFLKRGGQIKKVKISNSDYKDIYNFRFKPLTRAEKKKLKKKVEG